MSSTTHVTLNDAIWGAVGTLLDRIRYRLRRGLVLPHHKTEDDIKSVLLALERDGVMVIPGFYSALQCAEFRAEIDRLMMQQPEALHSGGTGADMRLFGAERASSVIRKFHNDVFLQKAADRYCGTPLKNFVTMAGRLQFQPGNLGSGEGWHRDAFHFQFKTMVYLTDVQNCNGPFQLLLRSHRPLQVFVDTVRGRLERAPKSRISEEQVARILKTDPQRLKTLIAKAGTLIIFDSSTIHRGAPIQSGTRYALTNYFYLPDQISRGLIAKFAPYAKTTG